MKKTNIILTILLFVSSAISAQSHDSAIKEIRTKYKYIRNNLNSFSLTKTDIWNESTEGGEGKAYFDKNDLKLIEIILYGETGKRIIEYYFDDEKLFFAFEQLFKYNAPIYLDKKRAKEEGYDVYFDPDKTTVNENRYYFENEILIQWLDNNKNEIDLTKDSNIKVGQELILHSNKMKEKLKK
jgi:hypothetical protein